MKALAVLVIACNIIFCVFGTVISVGSLTGYSGHGIGLNERGVFIVSILFGINGVLLIFTRHKIPSLPSVWPFIVIKRRTLEEKAKFDTLLEDDQEK